jgi:Rps23 Pro-64 3,4-dihydroxylase Tpa1-like proline 4-hydroxylase
MAYLDPGYILDTQLWRVLVEMLKTLYGDVEYHPVRIYSFQIRRLDATEVIRECESKSRQPDILVTLYLNKNWMKNDYGELLLLNETTGEVAVSTVPSHGRLVVWECNIPYLYKPPSISYKQGQYGLVFRVSRSRDSFDDAKSFYQEVQSRVKEGENFEFLHTAQHGLHILLNNDDVSSFKTRVFYDSKGRQIVIYDNLFSLEEINRLRIDIVKQYTRYMYQPFDEGSLEDNDNVQWIIPVTVEDFVRSRLWDVWKKVVADVTGNTDWYPYDVSINVIRGAEHTRIHQDCEEQEEEYTLLLYLNPEFDTPNSHGETSFFEEVSLPSGKKYYPGNEVYEMVAAIRPRFGRLVVFNGIIPHSARPPNVHVIVTRYTFAVKVMRTERVALSKALQEQLEGEQESENRKLLPLLDRGLSGYQSRHLLPTVDVLREKVRFETENRHDYLSEERERILQSIEESLETKK